MNVGLNKGLTKGLDNIIFMTSRSQLAASDVKLKKLFSYFALCSLKLLSVKNLELLSFCSKNNIFIYEYSSHQYSCSRVMCFS